ncbi:LysR family transcriptional regulator [Methylophaga sp.]|jgi:DNA-binding transcriptional LysR family regulator|uniref:LysR family transcriptional regulator n=1 Tax=Methylophaga sp. TaxID=2024840 RepID=UPI0013FFAE6D|nr:LysR family transcriptional regulator [Methylophaga sp.]MTI63959.1 LysR family transcriptional regulator [Methylophaga sp.]
MSQLEEMQTYVRIVEAGSITRAAEQLNTVKSAVSKRLTDLEKRLGVSLLKRTTRKQTLTDAGRDYYQHCVRILDDIDEVESALSDNQAALAGRIRMAAPISFGLMHLSPALREFNRIHPDIIFDIEFNDRQQDLVAEGIDLAIRVSNLADSSLVARKLSTTRLMVCGSPDYFARNGSPQTAEDLLYGHVKLQYSHVSPSWQMKNHQGERLSVNLPAVMTANNGQFLHDAAIEGKGLILSPDFICADAIRSGKLQAVLTNCLLDNEIGVYAVYPQTRYLSQRVRILIDFLREYFAQRPDWQCPSDD